jgi:two-component system, chemotaxis family, sensor kinase Cph1
MSINTDAQLLADLQQGCEEEKLHLSGHIQPFGAMLRVDVESMRITHASENLAEFVGTEARKILGRSIDETGWLSSQSFLKLPPQTGKTLVLTRVMEGAQGRIDALLIRGNSSILIELEKNSGLVEPIPIHQFQRSLMMPPHDRDELEEYHHNLLRAFQDITGYRRIMVYRFRDDWSGEVVAEATAPGMGSYLGLHFPASDIPAIARNLYMLNPSRMIPDATATAVPVIGIGADATPPDMTWSDLRSVSPVHLQYLSNMGVAASFSVPIRVAGKLWGLVACHNLQPRVLSPDQRNACVGLCSTYALGITSHFASRRLQMLDSLERRVDKIFQTLAEFPDPLDGIESNSQMLIDVMSAQGFAMAISDNVVISGEGPDLEALAHLDHWFVEECQESLTCIDHLADIFPQQPGLMGPISGMMAIKAKTLRSGWVRFYWFRPAEVQEIAWAGNPNKPMLENAGAIALSPRRSFDRWIENRSDFSRPWNNEEKMIASKFRNNLLRWL